MFVNICIMYLDGSVLVAYIFTVVYLLVRLISWSVCNFFFVSLRLCFNVYFCQYKYCYTSFLFVSTCMGDVFLSSHFQSVCFLRFAVSLWWAAYMWVIFFIHSAIAYLWIGAFGPFMFKVIIDRYVLTGILLIVFIVLLCSFFSSFSYLMTVFSVMFFVCISLIDFWFVVIMR